MNIKKVLKVTGISVIVAVVVMVTLYFAPHISNVWNAKTLGEIPTPMGYTRVDAPASSFAAFSRKLPLMPRGSRGHLYTGEAKGSHLSAGVVDITVLSNYEQCADMTMRLRAEWLFSRGRYSEISFKDVNGKRQTYTGGASHKALEKFWELADALREYGFIDAIYITGGADYTWWRESAGGEVRELGVASERHRNAYDGIVPWVIFCAKR